MSRAFPKIEAAMEAFKQRGATTPEVTTSTLSEADTSQRESPRATRLTDKKVEPNSGRLKKVLKDCVFFVLYFVRILQRNYC